MSPPPWFLSSFITLPELRALGVFDPEAEHVLGSVGGHAQRDVDRLVTDQALTPDLDPERVEEHQRIACLERPVLPFGDRLQDRVGDGRDEIGGDVDPIELNQIGPGSRARSCRIHTNLAVYSRTSLTIFLIAMGTTLSGTFSIVCLPAAVSRVTE
jgi:hypothetical protein